MDELDLQKELMVAYKDKNPKAALYFAAESGNLDRVRFLLENDADINDKDNFFCETALHAASRNDHLDIVRLLLENGADINDKDNLLGHTVLHTASRNGNLDRVRTLLEKGADINAPHKYGKTALMFAAANGHLELVRFLLENDADINAKDKTNQTFWDYLQTKNIKYLEQEYYETYKRNGIAKNYGLEVLQINFLLKFNKEVFAYLKDTILAYMEPNEEQLLKDALNKIGILNYEDKVKTLNKEINEEVNKQLLNYPLNIEFKIKKHEINSSEQKDNLVPNKIKAILS